MISDPYESRHEKASPHNMVQLTYYQGMILSFVHVTSQNYIQVKIF